MKEKQRALDVTYDCDPRQILDSILVKLNEFLKNIGKDHGVLDLRSPCCNVPFLRILETRVMHMFNDCIA